MTGPFHIFRHRAGAKRSSALIVTLVVLALATILVVSLASMISTERITTHESFENQRTRELAGIAVDEVVATLHDNIPANTIWAVAPGRLTYMTNGNFNTVLMCSGVATGTTTGTGQVDLNAPILGSSPTSYPIVSPNTEYPTAPQMPMAWVEVLQDGTLIRNGVTPTETPTKNNPIVGRYAYWVDTETSKANINTAGRGQATYNFTYNTNTGAFPAGGNDLQNLTASPSRLDLSQLDGNITTNQSDATFHYTYGGYWLGDVGDMITIPEINSSTNVPVYPQGMHRFNNIADWAQLPTTDSLFTNTPVTPITNTTQVEPNKFYLTTHSRTPDLTPWGYNKMWLQGADENAVSTGTLSYMGNRLNGKGVPAYPTTFALATSNYPGTAQPGSSGWPAPDSRYYYTPYISTNSAPQLVEPSRYDNGGMQGIANFVNAMMVQLNRTDWPGFQGHSFVEKYGERECEDLAFNILCLYDECVQAGAPGPGFYSDGYNGRNYYADWRGVYGGFSLFGKDAAGSDVGQTQIDGTNKLLGPVGEWPYFDQVSVEFQAPAGASTTGYNTAQEPNQLYVTNAEPFAGAVSPISGVDTAWPTKFPDRPAFACELSSQDIATNSPNLSGCNIIINPSAQVVYPPGFQNPFYSGHSAGSAGYTQWAMCDISVYATGMFNGQAVTYGSPTAPDSEKIGGVANPRHIPYYYWGPCDNLTSTNSAAGPGVYGFYYNTGTISFFGKNAQDLGYPPSLNPLVEIDSSTGTQTAQTLLFNGPYNNQSSLFIGPFSYGTVVTDIQFRARFVELRANVHTATVPVEIAPLAYNFPSTNFPAADGSPFYPSTGSMYFRWPSYQNEAETFANVAGNTGPNGQPYSPTFVFEVKNFLLGPANEIGQNVTYELSDPRAYRYTNQWTLRGPDAYGIENVPASYKSSYADGLTGITGDSSKFAWPNLGLAYYNSCYEGQNLALTVPSPPPYGFDRRSRQSGNNIQGFPGIGWLSMLPLNSESGQGNGSDDPNNPGKAVPWRTLSLEANQNAGTRVPDWLLLEAFSVAYDQTFCSHTEGKLNVNTSVTAAFPAGTTIAPRTKPLAALIDPASYPSAGNLTQAPMSAGTLTYVTNAIAAGPVNPGKLPSDIFMYPGQLCELNLLSATGTANQLQRESLMRDLIGTLTTQSSDFLVHVVAQSIKQINFNATVNPVTDLQVTSEQRMSALVSRLPNLGPDNIPDSGWTNPGANLGSAVADENVTGGVTNTITSMTVTSGITNTWVTSAPTFRYTVSDIQYANSQ